MAYIAKSDKARGVPGVVATGKKVAPETREARRAIATFVDGNADRLQMWLEEVYSEHGAKAALEAFSGFVEYHVPKLSRVEHKGEQVSEVIIKWGGVE